jgi:hypothetical protein
MALPMNSILDELRSLDGEIFRSELTQRLYLLLKSQTQDFLSQLTAKERGPAIERVLAWPSIVRDEELATLKARGAELDLLFAQVAMLYVKTAHKSNENRVVKIRNPRIEDLLRNFYRNVVATPWCKTGELWTFDPIKLDFCMREQFRKALMDSIEIIQEAPSERPSERPERERQITADDSASNFVLPESDEDDDETVKGREINDNATIKRGVSFNRRDETVYSSASNTSGRSRYANAIKPKIKSLDEPIKIILEEEEEVEQS